MDGRNRKPKRGADSSNDVTVKRGAEKREKETTENLENIEFEDPFEDEYDEEEVEEEDEEMDDAEDEDEGGEDEEMENQDEKPGEKEVENQFSELIQNLDVVDEEDEGEAEEIENARNAKVQSCSILPDAFSFFFPPLSSFLFLSLFFPFFPLTLKENKRVAPFLTPMFLHYFAQVFNPGVDKVNPDEELVYDYSVYEMLHRIEVEWPCLSFDVVPDKLGQRRTRVRNLSS
jgi:hypothetical protein